MLDAARLHNWVWRPEAWPYLQVLLHQTDLAEKVLVNCANLLVWKGKGHYFPHCAAVRCLLAWGTLLVQPMLGHFQIRLHYVIQWTSVTAVKQLA